MSLVNFEFHKRPKLKYGAGRAQETYHARNLLGRVFRVGTLIEKTLPAKDGTQTFFYHQNSKTLREYVRKDHDGKPHGESRVNYPNGAIHFIMQYEHGVLHGDWSGFHVTKAPHRTANRVSLAGRYDMGNKIGCWVKKDPFGNVEAETYYTGDEDETGFEITYDAQNKPVDLRALGGDLTEDVLKFAAKTMLQKFQENQITVKQQKDTLTTRKKSALFNQQMKTAEIESCFLDQEKELLKSEGVEQNKINEVLTLIAAAAPKNA